MAGGGTQRRTPEPGPLGARGRTRRLVPSNDNSGPAAARLRRRLALLFFLAGIVGLLTLSALGI